jgi:hypothetical protein
MSLGANRRPAKHNMPGPTSAPIAFETCGKFGLDKAFQGSLSVPGDHIMWVLGVSSLDAALEKLNDWRVAER